MPIRVRAIHVSSNMAAFALARIDGGTANSDAWKLRQKQAAELCQMLGMLTLQDGDSVRCAARSVKTSSGVPPRSSA